MKKTILIIAVLVLALGVLGVGVVFAQDGTPPYSGHGPMMQNGGTGVMHTFMTIEFAKQLNLNVNDVNTRIAAGETMYDIALSAGVTRYHRRCRAARRRRQGQGELRHAACRQQRKLADCRTLHHRPRQQDGGGRCCRNTQRRPASGPVCGGT